MAKLALTKFTHSCVLVEYKGMSVLFDPGDSSWNAHQAELDKLPQLDAIAITHEHADHFYFPFVEALAQKYPDITITSTAPVAEQLGHVLKSPVLTSSTDMFELFTAPHEDLPFHVAGPTNTGIHFSGIFTHPGDSHSFNESKQVLAMPMTAPWGSMVGALECIVELKPKVVLPIHDWHWRPEALTKFYERFKTTLQEQGIEFLIPVNGERYELNLL